MKCDLCNRPVPEDTVPERDARGRAAQLVCAECKAREGEGVRVLKDVDLIDQFEGHLAKVLPPETIH